MNEGAPTQITDPESLEKMEAQASRYGGWVADAFCNLAYNYRLATQQASEAVDEISYLRDLCRKHGIKYKVGSEAINEYRRCS